MKFSELVRLLKRSRAGISKSSSADALSLYQSASICAIGTDQSDPIAPIDLKRHVVKERPASEGF